MSSENRQRITSKLWVRIVAGLLAAMFAVFMIMLDLTRVRIKTDTGSDAENAAAGLLADTSDFAAKNSFERATDIFSTLFTNPETFDNYYALASMQIGQGKYEKALVSIDRCLHEYKGTLSTILDDLYMKKACVETLLGDYDSALKSFAEISSDSGESINMRRITAQIYLERGELSNAKKELLEYLKHYPYEMETREILAQVYYLTGEYSLGITQYTRLIEEYSDEGGIWHFMRGILYQESGNYSSAVMEFSTAVGLGFEDPAVCWEQQAVCYYLMGKHEEALLMGKEALRIGSDDLDEAVLCKYMGLSALSLALYDESISWLSESINAASDITDEYYFRGVCYMAVGDFGSAIEDFSFSIDAGQMQAVCYYNRAICYLQSSETDKAVEDLKQTLQTEQDTELALSAQELLSELE